MTNNSNIVQIFTDGACKGNPGPGGWGAILRYATTEKELKGYDPETTNNIMELTAVIEALKALSRSCPIVITTDSNYVKDGITVWISNWKKNNWKTSNKKPVKNVDLWMKLDNAIQNKKINWKWVKGHDGNEGNEKADFLARSALNNL